MTPYYCFVDPMLGVGRCVIIIIPYVFISQLKKLGHIWDYIIDDILDKIDIEEYIVLGFCHF